MKPHPAGFGFYWWMATILSVGGIVAWAISLDKANPDWSKWFNLVVAITIVLAGLCTISKLSSWWIRR